MRGKRQELKGNRFRGMVGGALYVEGRIVAFSVGEDLDGESLGVHHEKGLSGSKRVQPGGLSEEVPGADGVGCFGVLCNDFERDGQ